MSPVANTEINTQTTRVPLLAAENYEQWLPKIDYLLDNANVRWVIHEVTKEPKLPRATAGNEAHTEWEAAYRCYVTTSGSVNFAVYKKAWSNANNKAIRLLKAHSDGTREAEISQYESDGDTASKIWKRLEEKYGNKQDGNRQAKDWMELIDIVIPKDATHDEAQQKWDRLSYLNHRIMASKPPLEKILLFMGLKANQLRHQTVCDTLSCKTDATMEDVIKECQKSSERTRNAERTETRNLANNKVLTTKANNRGSKRKRGNNSNKDNKSTCSHCQKRGHDSTECWKKNPDKVPQWLKDKREYEKEQQPDSKKKKMSTGTKNE